MMRRLLAVSLVLASGQTFAAYADCTRGFGQNAVPPQVFRPPPIENQYARFSFGSHAFNENGEWYSWDFIKNEDTNDGLNAKWDKAYIDLEPAALPPGKAACHNEPLAEESEHPDLGQYVDRDSTITYSSTDQTQKAWLYVGHKVASDQGTSLPLKGNESIKDKFGHFIKSLFSTVYLDSKGMPHDLDVEVSSSYSKERLRISVTTYPPDFVVGFSNMKNLLGSENFEKVASDFKKDGYGIAIASATKFVGPDVSKLKLGEELASKEYLFLWGQKGAETLLPRSTISQLSRGISNIILLDDQRRPIASSSVTLYQMATSP